ncbi:hypothetical protein I3842_03G063000 [Carya illinoinensis]|uniref:RING-type E3 ubiquitin transferase n=1 Tax=Carya illinoinensis TaxID=32201 RepID=A0A922JU07_CARIL|nr:hypothetical protein I3842_03G063000 [Carya illinoinensis]
MAKFSLDRDEDGEGPSSPEPKRLRISVQSDVAGRDNQEQYEEEEGKESDEDEGEDEIYEEEDSEEDASEEVEEEEISEEEAQRWQEEDSSVSVGPRSNVGGQLCRDGSITVTLTDPEVLDCTICFEPLSCPVFQCENGHIACSSCCIRLLNKCPSCSWPIGYNRCRSIEKVLEAVKISCPNTGCKEAVSYSKKNEHGKTCMYAPCSCPLSNCNFIDSYKQLYLHFSRKHPSSAVGFLYDCMFSISLNVDEKFIVLREQYDGVLFVLNNSIELLGNILAISCIGPCSSTRGFVYTLLARAHGDILRLQSSTKYIQQRVDDPPSTCFILIPSDFFVSGQLKLDVRIQQNNAAAAAAASTCDQRRIGAI